MVEQNFSVFADSWLQKLNRELLARPKNPVVTRTSDGFEARVVRIDAAGRTLSVEPTEVPATPYLGTLTYIVRTSVSRAPDRDKAVQGPFLPEETIRTTEIFLYQEGQWGSQQ